MKVRLLSGIFLISTATLCLEMSLTRYFSISQHYHFAFLVVSIAFMGFGASGSFLTFFEKLHALEQDKFLSSSSLLFSLTTLLSFFLCNTIPFDLNKLSWDKKQIGLIFLYYLLLSIPFFFAGLTIAFAISSTPRAVNTIYFSDLIGAGAGSLAVLAVFLPKGDRGVILMISFLALLSSLLFSLKRPLYLKLILLCLMAGEIGLFLWAPNWLSFRISPFKALPVALKYPQAQHITTKWNAISRIDVLDSPALRYAPGLSLLYERTLPPQIGLSIDGGELSAVTQFKDIKDSSLEFISFLPSSLAYSLLDRPQALILEPKGGLDVLSALYFDASRIKIIENNPLVNKLMQEDLAHPSGDLYQRGKVQSLSAYSRAAIKQEQESYDLIVFSLTDVFGASETGIYGLGENFLFTTQSFIRLLNCLSPDGMISMSLYLLPPPRQEVRALATWVEALETSGLSPATQIMVIRSWGTISFFIKKSPFNPQDIKKLKNFADRYLFDLVYYPGIRPEETNIYNTFDKPLYYDLALKLLVPKERKNLYKDYLFKIKPAKDNSPFFFNTFKLNRIKATYRTLGQKWLPFLQGEFLVPLLFVQSFMAAFVFILLPLLALRNKRDLKRGVASKSFFYFSLIGMAFMFVEITLIHKFILFLGHPLYSISIIIFSLLFSTGLGSFFSRKILGQNIKQNLRWCLLLCAGLVVLNLLLFPFFSESFISFNLPVKMILTFLVTFPLGFVMGFPFPSGIRLLEEKEKRLIPWAWATNAFSSVVNSISALMIAFWTGYGLVLFLASGGYILALLFLDFSNHRDKTNI